MFNFMKMIKRRSFKEEEQNNIYVKRGVFEVENKLIAGAYYEDDNIKAIATDIGCIKLNSKPKLVEDINLQTTKIESLLMKLKYKKVENFMFVKELC